MRHLEWLLRDQLKAGLQTIRNDTTVIDKMFPDLTENSRTHLKQWIVNHEISVLLGYPRNVEDIPCWVIAMSGERNHTTAIGEFHETVSVGSPTITGYEEISGDMTSKSYTIFTMTQNADLTVILSSILQHILKSIRKPLALAGFYQMVTSQQDALNIRADFLPNYLYVRATSLSVIADDEFTKVDTGLIEQVTFLPQTEIDLNQ